MVQVRKESKVPLLGFFLTLLFQNGSVTFLLIRIIQYRHPSKMEG